MGCHSALEEGDLHLQPAHAGGGQAVHVGGHADSWRRRVLQQGHACEGAQLRA